MIILGKKYVDEPSGVKPALEYAETKDAFEDAITISAKPTNEKPAPAATPFTATIKGAFILDNLEIAPCNEVVTSLR